MVAKITHIELDIREHQAFTSKNKYFLARNFLFRVLGDLTSPRDGVEEIFFRRPLAEGQVWGSALKIPDRLILLELMSR